MINEIDEKIFNSKKDIKYVFKEVENSNKLIIVFSGYSNNPTIKAPYNYMKSLENIKINKLFISDSHGYDGRGCWYLGENGNKDVEKSVIELITYIMKQLNIRKEDVILAGTSKGGFASLYYGIKYKFGNIISGGPQIYLYDYLSGLNNKSIMECIVKEQSTLEHILKINKAKSRLNKLIVNIPIEKTTNINIICGINDTHFKRHVMPFVEKNINLSNIYLEIVYGEHKNLGEIYKDRLPNIVNDIINNKEYRKIKLPTNKKLQNNLIIKDIEDVFNEDIINIKIKDNKLSTSMYVANINYKYACYVYYKDRVEKQKYKSNPYFEFNVTKSPIYRIKWFVKDEVGNVITREVKIKNKLNEINN